LKVRDVIKLVESDGWVFVRMRGDHRHYEHSTKQGIVTIAGHPGDEMVRGTQRSVFRQAQIKWKAKGK